MNVAAIAILKIKRSTLERKFRCAEEQKMKKKKLGLILRACLRRKE